MYQQTVIDRFNRVEAPMIFVPAGKYMHDGLRLFQYPEYTGPKEDIFIYYQSLADIIGWGSDVYNAIMVTVMNQTVPFQGEIQ